MALQNGLLPVARRSETPRAAWCNSVARVKTLQNAGLHKPNSVRAKNGFILRLRPERCSPTSGTLAPMRSYVHQRALRFSGWMRRHPRPARKYWPGFTQRIEKDLRLRLLSLVLTCPALKLAFG